MLEQTSAPSQVHPVPTSATVPADQNASGGFGWLLYHPVMLMGVVFAVGIFAAFFNMFSEAVPRLTGVTAWVVPPMLIVLAAGVALFVEGGRRPQRP